jgi:alpha-galactosidase
MDEITYTCAGINHTAWYLDYRWKGEDAYPLIRKAILDNEATYNAEQVRNEMYLAFDYYVTESSGHNSEYNWWFRKRPELIEKYCTHGTNWNPGEYAYILKEYQRRENDWKDDIHEWFENKEVELERGHEYAAYIMDAMSGGAPFQFNGNVPNKNLVDNLPTDACVEVPVWVSSKGLEPVAIGALPATVTPLTALSSQIEELAVEGILSGNRRLIYQAVAYSPLSAAVLSLEEIQKMVDELFAVNETHLPPQFDRA